MIDIAIVVGIWFIWLSLLIVSHTLKQILKVLIAMYKLSGGRVKGGS